MGCATLEDAMTLTDASVVRIVTDIDCRCERDAEECYRVGNGRV